MRSSRSFRWSTAILTLAIGFGIATTIQAEAVSETSSSGCQTTGRYEVCITDPAEHDGADTTIINKLRKYVQSSNDGAITGGMYLWDMDEQPETKDFIDDLGAAKQRGVAVNLVVGKVVAEKDLDGDGDKEKYDRNAAAIKELRHHGIAVTQCDKGCIPNSSGEKAGTMHMKFFTFSSGDTLRVVHTSSNLSQGQFERHQNLLSVTGDKALYYHYVGYWNRLKAGSWNYQGEKWTGGDRAREGDVAGTKAYFFPRSEADPVRGTLEKLDCVEGHDRVWVAASLFYTSERLPVLNVLDSLRSEGCDVRVVVARADDRNWVLDNSDLAPETVRLLDGVKGVWASQHNKLIVTNALYEDGERTAVYAGSHNLNAGSLRNSSDGMLRITDSGVYDIYANYFERLYSLASD